MMTDMRDKITAKIRNNHIMIALVIHVFFVLCPIQSHAALVEFGDTYDPNEYQEYCNVEKFNKKYEGADASCWSCDIITMMTDYMLSAANILSNASIELGKIILLIGAAIWLAMYFLKSLGSLTEQDPARVLDGAFTFMFKMALVYILLFNGGFLAIVDYIVNPILRIGSDIGKDLYKLTGF